MTFWTYMLHCRHGLFYVGHTDDLDRRIVQHQTGAVPGFARTYAPVTLVWSETFPTRYEALAAERQLKGWRKAKKLALIRGDFALISALAKEKTGPSTGSGRTDHRFVHARPIEAHKRTGRSGHAEPVEASLFASSRNP